MLTPTLSETLRKKALDAFLVTHKENIAYLSGFYGSMGALLLSQNPILFVDGRYYTQAKEEAHNCEVILARNSFWEVVTNYLMEIKVKRLGFEEGNISYRTYRALRKKLKGVSLVPCSDVVERERMLKKAWEIERIEKALKLSEEALFHSLTTIKEGMSEKDLALELEFFLKKKGGELAFESIIAFGERSALPHAKPTNRKLKKGDIILIDMGAKMEGYCSDITRVFFFGQPKEELLRIYKAVLRAQERAIEEIKEGKRGGAIDEVAREELKEQGLAEFFTHSLGHGVGREIHELPRLAPGNKDKLPSSAVVTIEPGVYIEGLGGVRIEDMVLIGKNISRNLTNFPKELTIL